MMIQPRNRFVQPLQWVLVIYVDAFDRNIAAVSFSFLHIALDSYQQRHLYDQLQSMVTIQDLGFFCGSIRNVRACTGCGITDARSAIGHV